MNEEATPKAIHVEVQAKQENLSGIYANMARVSSGEHDATLDFIMMDSASINGDKAQAYLVSRIVVAHTMLPQIVDMLERHIENLSKK